MSTDSLDPDEARTRLYEIMAGDAPFERKAEEAIDLGKEYLGVDNGHLARVDPGTEYWEAIVSTDPDNGDFPVGHVEDLRETYCRRTITGDSSVGLHDAPAQGWADDPAFEAHGLRCYHGTTITIDEETYGTLCFVSEERREPFTDEETMFAELVARMLEHELERERHQEELTRRANLITVLNRVLRHNLRNNLSVVRGHVDILADRIDEETGGAREVIDAVDDLLDLSEKARDLEAVIGEEFQRREVAVTPLVRRLVESAATEYPQVSFTVEGADDATVSVLPSLEAALTELIDNAAKHTDGGSVTVSVLPRPDDVRVRVADDGPGLPDQERAVLDEGAETPLVHGSGIGLWLVNWIVTGNDGTIETDVSEAGTTISVTLPRATDVPSVDDRPDQRRLERAQDRFQAVFEEAFDAMVITDDEGHLLDANRSAADLYGVTPRDLRGRAFGSFLPDGVGIDGAWGQLRDTEGTRGTVPVVRPDGTERTVEYAVTADVVPGQHLVVMRDVTERKRRERELETATRRLRAILENTRSPMFMKDAAGEYLLVNRGFRELFDLGERDVVGRTDEELFPPEMAAEVRANDQRVIDEGEPIETEERIVVDGETRICLSSKVPIYDAGTETDPESPVAVFGIARDVTDQKRRERELELADTVFRNTQDAIFIVDVTEDREFRVRRVNERYETLTGITNEEIQGKTPPEVVGDAVGAGIEARYRECLERGATIEYREEIPVDGEQRHWDTKLTPVVEDGEVVQLVGAMRDVTERVERERDLERYETVVETINDGAWVFDADKRISFANREFLDRLSMDREEVLGTPLSAFRHLFTDPATYETYEDVVEEMLAGETRAADLDVVFDLPAGRTVANVRFAPVSDGTDPSGVVAVARDVTDRADREQALRQHEAVLETISDIAYLIDRDRTIAYINERGASALGVTREEAVGQSVCSLVEEFTSDPTVADQHLDYVEELFAGERDEARIEMPIRTESRGEIAMDVRIAPYVEDGAIEGVVATAREIERYTERERSHPDT